MDQVGAKIHFVIRTDLPHVTNPLEFWVYFQQTRDRSITSALSRHGSDDLEMNDLFALIYESQSAADIEAFVQHIHSVSPYFWRLDGREYVMGRDATDKSANQIVSYLNMDLNDFGRKNDVRESVKDLQLHFKDEIVDRLGIPFTEQGEGVLPESIRDRLNQILDRVIRDHPGYSHSQRELTNAHDVQPLFQVTKCTLDPQGIVNVLARRRGETHESPLTHMSAGENECFFIFLLLLGLPTQESIILFDEPDLHLAVFARDAFFQELYSVLKERGCQTIIATHSGFAYTEPGRSERKLIRRRPDPSRPGPRYWIYTDDFTEEFALHLHLYYWRTALRTIRYIGVRNPFKDIVHVAWSRIKLWAKGHPIVAGAIGGSFPIALSAIAALISDFLETVNLQRPETHTLLTNYIVWTGIGVGFAVLAITSFLSRSVR